MKTLQLNLTCWEWISAAVAELLVPQNTRSAPPLQLPMGSPSPAQLLNKCNSAHLHIETLQCNLSWCESVQLLWGYGFCWIQETQLPGLPFSCPWAAHNLPNCSWISKSCSLERSVITDSDGADLQFDKTVGLGPVLWTTCLRRPFMPFRTLASRDSFHYMLHTIDWLSIRVNVYETH